MSDVIFLTALRLLLIKAIAFGTNHLHHFRYHRHFQIQVVGYHQIQRIEIFETFQFFKSAGLINDLI